MVVITHRLHGQSADEATFASDEEGNVLTFEDTRQATDYVSKVLLPSLPHVEPPGYRITLEHAEHAIGPKKPYSPPPPPPAS